MSKPDSAWSMNDCPKFFISVGPLDLPTTQKGLQAFEGAEDLVFDGRPFDWTLEGTQPLIGAVLGKHRELAVRLIRAGSPIDRDVYGTAFTHLPELLSELPPNESLAEEFRRARDWTVLNWAILRGESENVRRLLSNHFPINEKVLLTHGMGSLAPIHYAVRGGSLEVIGLVIGAGADVNLLSNDGKSPLRVLLENVRMMPAANLRACAAILRKTGAEVLPPPENIFDRLKGRLGFRISLPTLEKRR